MLKINKNNRLYQITKGYIISIILSIVGIYIFSIILVNTNIQENTIRPVIIIISSISILIGSSISCLKIKKKGIINGVSVAIIYYCSMFILSSVILCGFSFNINSVIMITVGVILGGVGGIIGVNLK